MIDWDGHGTYSFEELDELERFYLNLRTKNLRFMYRTRSDTVIDGQVRIGESTGSPAVINFLEYSTEGKRIFGVTGNLLGSIVAYDPVEIAEGVLLPDSNFAVRRGCDESIATIASPVQTIHYPPINT